MASNARPYWNSEDSDDDINISMISKAPASIQSLSFFPVSAQQERTRISSTAPLCTLPSTSDAFKPLRLEFGEVSEEGPTFVPFKLVRGYPGRYVGRSNQKKVFEFFKETLLKNRVWDLFAQSDPTAKHGPLLLIPTIQFEQFLNIANHQLDGELAIPQGRAGELFSLTFGEWDTPRPRFLGRANSASAVDSLRERAHTLPADDLSHLTPSCYQMYQDKIDEIYSSLKIGKKSNKLEAAKNKRVQKKKDSGRMLKRVQRYLGLRQAISHVSSNSYRGLVTTSWGSQKPAPFKPKESVRFVCVDVEAYEEDARVVTEIGLAVLDTEDLIDICPGERGENWFSLVQAYHFRIEERRYIVNSKFVQGCPEAFDFGKSQMVSIKDINKVVGKVIGDKNSEDQRPVIIVGHDIRQDLKYLTSIGYNPWGVPLIVDEVDTQAMFQRIERGPNGRSLALICAELGIPGCNYHNAGNDAVYTLRAMIAMAIKRTIDGSDRKEESFTPGTDEWTDGDMDDGGCSKRSAPPAETYCAHQSKDELQNVQW
ncbi:hypothetical protein E0Z10_g1038 [Xylaria hypoxylon]|uniref:Gfd2/YDR514C-like C-terminal domain-containing protein n=1 Tax=Xylaria hypoxylon TaxID=37992 RepID=A0A4Z0ZFX0_9PEZI|nr:hypothetical protein E0Z10_g1038 [Xylaria hypoxylon]